MIRGLFRLAVIVSAFTVFSLANTALSWHLPLPDLIPHTEPTPPCVLPGAPVGPPGAPTTPPASTTAYGQPAGFGAVIPDLPSAMGKVQGQLLHKLDGPPPSQAQIHAAASAVGSGLARWAASFRSAARGQKDPASVTAYQGRQRAAFLAQNTASCNPCNPRADGSPDPSRQAGYATGPTTTGLPGEPVARKALAAAGFTGNDLELMVWVGAKESGFRSVRNSIGASGWWQVLQSAHPDLFATMGDWRDPYVNARMARRVWLDSQAAHRDPFQPWTTRGAARAALAQHPAQTVAAQPAAGGMQCAAFNTTYKTGAGVAWGGYQNGRIPLSALAHPRSAPGHWFRPDAAAAFDRLSAAYAVSFGRPLGITDSYRDYAHQVSTKAAKGGLAATPGTSNHGWGLAADLIVGGYSDPRYVWMRANAPRFGWDNPAWGRPGGSGPHESWHFEFNPPGAAT